MRFIRTLAALIFLVSAVSAQETSGSITGTVMDSSGSAIPGAQVTARHSETGTTRNAQAGADGRYTLMDLPIGAYQISAQHTGFKRAAKSLQLHVSDHLAVDLTLEVGELTQEISVSANVEQVETESSEQGSLITGEQVRDLQLNGRSFMTLLELVPGVASDMPDRADPNTKPTMQINGARPSGQSFNIDGASNADIIIGGGALNTFTSVETVAEFKVVTSTFAAEYGRGGLSQVNVVTKGGGQKFRGSMYEFFRNDALDARDYFTHQVLPLRLNNFGYTFGGPVTLPFYNRDRSKTFFFWTQEFSRVRERGAAVNTTVPTVAERNGDFSGSDIIDPATGIGFPGGVIPKSRMDPNGVKLANLYPDPNWQGPGRLNYTTAFPGRQDWREELIRIDHNFSQKLKVFGRFSNDTADIFSPYGGSFASSVASKIPGISATNSARPGKNFVFRATMIPSASLVNEASVSYTSRRIQQNIASNMGTRTALGINIPEIFPGNDQDLIPQIGLGSDYSGINIPRETLKKLFSIDVTDNLTKTFGRHVFKAGFLYSFGGNQEQNGANTNGSFTFNTAFSKDPVANLLLGLPYTYSEDEAVIVSRIRFGILEGYVQDDFRATPRLNLNFGVRWSNFFNPYDTHNLLSNFLPWLYDPAKAPEIVRSTGRPVPGTGDPLNGIIVAGKSSPWGRRVTQNDTNLWGPRFGFAYDLFGNRKTALRGGAGMYYTRPMLGSFINSAWSNPPFSRDITYNNPLLGNPNGGSEAPVGVTALTTLGTPLVASTVYQWSMGVQQELFQQALLSVNYVGSRGLRLMNNININTPQAGSVVTGVNVNAVRPYPGYGNINERRMSGSSVYHSLQATLNRRMARSLTFGLAYTWSKSIDVSSGERGTSPPDVYNIRMRERALSDFDRPHILTANFIYNLPRPVKGRTSVPALVLNGWQLSGIVRMFSGKPFDVTLSQDVARTGVTQGQRPDIAGDTKGPRTTEEWFSRSAFARPESGTFGNMGRNSLRGPGVNKWDLSMFKNFALGEGRQLQFRSEFFNALNHPSFTTVAANLNTTGTTVRPELNNFGMVTNTRDARVLQFGLKLSF